MSDDLHPLLAKTPERVVFAGDWHGNTNFGCGRITSAASHGAEVLLHVGDFGLWQGQQGAAYLGALEKVCGRVGLPVLWIDGNHENFDLVAELPREGGLGRVSDHIWHAPRGTRWQWGGVRWGGLGGATSVDKRTRVPGESWWPQEELTSADVATWIDGGPVDVVLTHDAPAGFDIPGITHKDGVLWWGGEAISIAEAHRERLADALVPTRPALVVHGHFHVRYETRWHYPGGRARVVGLDCDNYLPPRNTWLVDLQEIADIVAQERGV